MNDIRPDHHRGRAALALLAALALTAPLFTGAARADDHTGDAPNLVTNHDFSQGIFSWWGLDNADVDDELRRACIDFPVQGAQFGNWTNLGLEEGQTYTFGFTAWGDRDAEGLRAYVETDGGGGRGTSPSPSASPPSPSATHGPSPRPARSGSSSPRTLRPPTASASPTCTSRPLPSSSRTPASMAWPHGGRPVSP